MQDKLMQVQTQPFIKLAQANMELLMRFLTSSEVTSQATANVSQIFQQGGESAIEFMPAGAFAHLMQGFLANYTEFLTDLSHSSMMMLSQGQPAMNRQAT